jgi:hypothetical protein
MVEHIARHPWVRDRSIFVGDPDDIVPDTFGPGLPAIRDWTEQHYSFSGYITGLTQPSSPTGPPCAQTSAISPASASASSPSAAQGSGAGSWPV